MVGFYKHDIPAWMDGTENLSDAAYRAYHVVVQLIMLNEGPITPNDRGIAGRCNMTVKAFTKALAELLAAGKLTMHDGRICNARAAVELRFVEKNRENAGKGGKTRAFREKAGKNESGRTSNPLENNDAGQAALNDVSSLKDERRLDKTVEKEATPLPLLVDDGFPEGAFDIWWGVQPNKVAKPAAEKSFNRVRKQKLATFAELMDGLRRYIATKPEHYDWVGPAVWLNQGRWADQPAPPGDAKRRTPTGRPPAADFWAADALDANTEMQGGHDDHGSHDHHRNWDRAGRQADGRPYRDAPQSAGNDPRQLPPLRLVGGL